MPLAAQLLAEEMAWEHHSGDFCEPNPHPCGDPAEVIAKIKSIASAHTVVRHSGWVTGTGDGRVLMDYVNDIQKHTPQFWGGGPALLMKTYPQIISPITAETSVFNQQVSALVASLWAAFGAPATLNSPKYAKAVYELNATALEGAPQFLPGVMVVQFNISDQVPGSTGYSESENLNWLLSQERELNPGDIFDLQTDWKDALFTQIDAQWTKEGGSGSLDAIKDQFFDPRHWTLTQNNLEFDPSRNWSTGLDNNGEEGVVITVPWSNLTPFLKKDGLVFRASVP